MRRTYDESGNLKSLIDPTGHIAHFQYDAVNRADRTEDPAQGVRLFAYDFKDNPKLVTDANGNATSFKYDVHGREVERADALGNTWNIAYDSRDNMVARQVLYDAATGRPDRIEHDKGAVTLASFDYGFDVDGKTTSIADAGGVRNFTYDATLQLTGGGYASAPESYSYDAEGNRTSSHLSGAYVHDTANRLREDDTTCYDYDANGNLTTKTAKLAGACTGAVTSYTWDVLNRLVRIDNPDATYSAYRYDAQGRRIEKDVNGALTRYVYDDDAILLEYDGANALLATYSHGQEVDQPLAMTRGGGSYFYHTDHLGSVRLLTDAAGAVISRYDYDSFGNLEATSFEGVANPYTFTAREHDAESGLMFYRARYYNPQIGRFISQDPIGFEAGDLNLYRYVFNGPLHGTDPSGKFLLAEAGADIIWEVKQAVVAHAKVSALTILWATYLTSVTGTVLSAPLGECSAAWTGFVSGTSMAAALHPNKYNAFSVGMASVLWGVAGNVACASAAMVQEMV